MMGLMEGNDDDGTHGRYDDDGRNGR